VGTHKALGNDDYKIEPYVAHSSQSFIIVSGSDVNPSGLTLSIATEPPANWLTTGNKGFFNVESGIYSNILFQSIKHLFYTQGNQVFYSSSVADVTRYFPTASVYVLSAATNVFGEQIKPNSVKIRLNNLPTFIYDVPSTTPQMGLLLVSGSQDVVGNVFYSHGIMTVEVNNSFNTVDSNGIKLAEEDSISVEFQSTVTIYNHRVTCEIEPNEFNVAWFNPTISASFAASSSVDGQGQKIYDLMASGSLTPYVTTIGLYNDEHQLLAVAKLSSPIKRSFLTKQTFIVKFDTN
jgi:hypothetical protein